MDTTKVWGLLINGHLNGWIKHRHKPSESTDISTKFVFAHRVQKKVNRHKCKCAHQYIFYSGVLWSFSALIQSTFSLGAPWSPIHAAHCRWRSGRSGLDAPVLTDEACKASGMTPSTGKSAALAPLLKHSSHHLSCWVLQRATIVPPSTPIRSCRFRRGVARRHLQSSSVSPGL